MEKIMNWYKRERKTLFASILCGVLVTTAFGLHTRAYSYQSIESIASQVVRFHVLPNSNSQEDQALKNRVKEEVLREYHDTLSAFTSIEESRNFLNSNLAEIELFAQNIVYSEGFSYPVNVSLENSAFPTRVYGDITLPAGTYEALRIEIGESNGANWWCIMFPPLCFVDVTRSEIHPDTRESLMNLLSENDFALLDNNTRENDPLVRVRFAVVEWWQDNGIEEEIILVLGDSISF